MLLEMSQSATEKSHNCDLEWRTTEMQYACCGSALAESDLEFNMNGVDCKMPRVRGMLVMGSLLANEADTMSAMRHCTNKGMSALRPEMYQLKERSTKGTNRSYKGQLAAHVGQRTGRHAAWL